ncbi:pyocin knob domain-containing S74 family peptidase [Atlantibacter sp.]|uniref:pyocin knob domain-containing S74 family peptidase n=1 Tax=Atlantibacter sp. TaxID=1903473 RepID=UPI0028AF5EC8|nr:pyocin knob domain-containing S74 family peptidase [Atlantibacter sp.]
MSAGTLKLTNNSTAVVGTSTVFTTDLKPGDFIVTTIGGVLYTLPVDAVTSNTAATLVSPFTGPTTTGAAWAAVPRKTMNQVTAELVAQSTEALRGLLTEKGVWTNFYTAPGDITVQLTSSMPAVTGPGWQKMAGLVGSSLQWRGNLPAAANLNGYGPTAAFTGIWSRSTNTNTTAAYNFPEDNGQGVLEVFAGGLYGGTQRYTTRTGNIYTRNLSAAWNGTDGPWGDWNLVGVNSRPGYYEGDLNALLTPGTWSVTAAATNGPVSPGQAGVATGICEVILRTSANSLLQRYTNITTGAANINRTWQRTLSGTTWSAWELLGIKALNDIGLGLINQTALTTLDWQQFDFVSGASYLVSTSVWANAPSGVSYPAGTQVFISVDGIASSGTVIELTLIANQANDANYRIYKVRIANAKGARTFSVRQALTSASVGSTSGTIAAGNDERLNSLDGKSGGTVTGQIKNLPSTGQGETKTAPYNAPITHGGALPLFAHGHSVTIQKNGGVGALFTLGMSFGGYIGSAGTADASGPMITCSDGTVYTKYWNFVNGSGGINTANGGILPTVCDIRLKDNPRPAQPGAMTRILSIQSREFNWKWDGRHDRGFIAQELKKVDPLYVFEAGGEDPDEPILNLSHIAIISDLVAAVQGLHEQNVTQLNEITSLRQELDELKEKVDQLIAN